MDVPISLPPSTLYNTNVFYAFFHILVRPFRLSFTFFLAKFVTIRTATALPKSLFTSTFIFLYPHFEDPARAFGGFDLWWGEELPDLGLG